MSRKILRRCDICGRFHAAYLVPDEDGQARNYCYDCWKARFEVMLPATKNIYDETINSSIPKKDPS